MTMYLALWQSDAGQWLTGMTEDGEDRTAPVPVPVPSGPLASVADSARSIWQGVGIEPLTPWEPEDLGEGAQGARGSIVWLSVAWSDGDR